MCDFPAREPTFDAFSEFLTPFTNFSRRGGWGGGGFEKEAQDNPEMSFLSWSLVQRIYIYNNLK